MNSTIAGLQPEAIWRNFAKLLSIPRPSKHEGRIIAFMKEFGEGLGLETIVDPTGNVIIRKPATPGMENRQGVILQGHLDMVPQKNSDISHDFLNDPIDAWIDSDWVKARGTTLGADNGMGVAAAMAVLEATDLPHGPVEALFTIDEETGMTGAFNLQPGILKGDILMNLDSEDEGELYIGCAGGMNATMSFSYTEEPAPSGHTAFRLSVTGMKGGHSGMDIVLGRGNAIKSLNRFIWEQEERLGLRIAKLDGGGLRNAIPREALCVLTLPKEKSDELKANFSMFSEIIKSELKSTEPELRTGIEAIEMPDT
ncbi:MAG: beta-Ala-His dipeptidase, partial [Bacteroidales bacterium]|nr:beta-Ala-His dipeptidase [Bacteroidales bacterium]